MSDATAQAVIGLSFGSGYSCIAILNKDQQPEIIANADGEHKTATAISFLGDEVLFGSEAKAQTVRNATNTVCDFQPLVGLPFDASRAQALSANTVVDKGGRFGFQVQFNGETCIFTAEDLAVKFIQHLVATAENYIGAKVGGVVLADPSQYTADQSRVLGTLIQSAGFRLLQLVREAPTAALAYSLGCTATPQDPQDTNILVADVGYSATQITVLTVRGGLYSVLASASDRQFCGQAFDAILTTYFANEFKNLNKVDIAGNTRAQAKLALACELTKRALTNSKTAPCSVESLAEGLDLHANINRMRFDILSSKLYSVLATLVNQALGAAGLHTDEIDQVLLVGGAARVPKVQGKLQALFPGTTQFRQELEADEVIATGCAKQARLITAGQATSDVEQSPAPAMAQPLGLRLGEKDFVTVIPRHTPVPAVRTVQVVSPTTTAYFAIAQAQATIQEFTVPAEDEDDEDEIQRKTVFEPQLLLAELALANVTANATLDLTFHVDTAKALTVTVVDPASQRSASVRVA
ncbi:Hsp70 protein that interacts with Zuo1p [Dimargaris xerosporica]|nr:Hsp70 protein that interacts with Zuo1p [Dimargaris xerosporica]